MQKRHKQILTLLNNKNWITGKALSSILGVTDRTIRYDIEKINFEFNSIVIESNTKQGYRLSSSFNYFDTMPQNQIPQTPKERYNYILKQLLINKQNTYINQLIEDIYISEYSLDNDLKKIKEILKNYDNLTILKSKQNLYLKGPEQSKRKLYKDMLMEETQNNLFNLNEIASLYNKFDLLKAKRCLECILDKYNYKISTISFPVLIVHVGITIERLMNFHYIDNIALNVDINETIEFKIATEFFEQLAKLYQIENYGSEIILFSLLLMTKKNQDTYSLTGNLVYEELVRELIDHIYKQFGIDFSIDNELAVGLSLHIQSLLERSKINADSSNLYLEEIKKRFPLVFELSVAACDYLQNKLNIKICESEIGFVALHLGTAYERQNSQKYRAVLLLPNSHGIYTELIAKLKNTFEHHLDIVAVLNYFEEEKIKTLSCDLIISSIPIIHNLNIVTVLISVFFNYQDEVKIFQAINECEQRKLQKDYRKYLANIIKKENFYLNKEFKTPKEAISFLCDKLYQKNEVSEDYLNSVLARETMSSTSFIQGFAIPHSLNTDSINNSSISIMILNKPITWDNYEVQIIFLLTIKNMESEVMKLFFNWMSDLSSDISKLSTILKSKSFEDFIEVFEN